MTLHIASVQPAMTAIGLFSIVASYYTAAIFFFKSAGMSYLKETNRQLVFWWQNPKA